MTVAELRRLAPPGAEAWDARLAEIGAAAAAMAYAARPAKGELEEYRHGRAAIDLLTIHTPALDQQHHWSDLSPAERGGWFVLAWRVITGAEAP